MGRREVSQIHESINRFMEEDIDSAQFGRRVTATIERHSNLAPTFDFIRSHEDMVYTRWVNQIGHTMVENATRSLAEERRRAQDQERLLEERMNDYMDYYRQMTEQEGKEQEESSQE